MTTQINARFSARRSGAAIAVAAFLGLGLGACSTDADADADASPSPSSSSSAPSAEPSTGTASPTATPSATATPTPTPTPTPEPEPEPDPNAFAPTTVTGTGASVVPVPAGSSLGTIAASHEGSSNFALWAMDASNNQLDLLVNEIGSYTGTVPWGFRDDDVTSVQVEADGNWSLTFSSVSSAPQLTLPASGTGDTVLIYQGGAATPSFTHQGESNFAVWVYGSSSDLLINEIGAYTGTHALKAGPAFIVVEADGAWTIG
ncbi:hypothetical protein C8046_08495 [Serinibacter arcticus]|uniref:Uncharacterized protein n=1 Tax=Serinibacter arcticus TaxID=1655435 RepID=A0A2U1ZUL5_9MICO|nr:hypothetical protein [Serinibacter arcticus]PWD50687.1 hypothetical protein C8046_08495 [Serinibacter arcticus]